MARNEKQKHELRKHTDLSKNPRREKIIGIGDN